MQRLIIAAGLAFLAQHVGVAEAGPTVAAKDKKKSKKKKKKKVDLNTPMPPPKNTGGEGGDAGGEIEMEGSSAPGADSPDAPPPPSLTPSEPQAETPAAGPKAPIAPAINDRPLTAPKKRIEAHVGLPIAHLSLPDFMGGSTSATSEGLAFGASYGIDDKLEIGGDYAISLHPGEVKGPLVLHGAYHVVGNAKLDIAVAGALVIQPIPATDPLTGMSSTTVYAGLDLGAWVRYRVAPKVSVFTGLPALPHGGVSLSRLSFPLPPEPYALAIGLNHSGAISFSVPAGVGFQATPVIYAYVAVTLAQFDIKNTQNAFLIRDFIPVTAGGFYTVDKVDVGASIGTDGNRLDGAGLITFQLSARSYF